MDIFYIDGEFVPADKAVIPVNDLAILRGYGVFDFTCTYKGKPFLLEEHIKRLEHSAGIIGLHLPWTCDEIIEIVEETLKKNDHTESNIRVVVTGGSSPDFITPQDNPRLLVLVTPVQKLPVEWFENGVKIITVYTDRFITGAKSINYLPATMALKKARAKNAVEAVYIDREEIVQEGTTSNVFSFIGNVLVTPARKILSGITRRVVLELAAEEYEIVIRDISRNEILLADEVFITGTSKGLVPVVQIDDAVIGNGRPGEKTRYLIKLLEAYTVG